MHTQGNCCYTLLSMVHKALQLCQPEQLQILIVQDGNTAKARSRNLKSAELCSSESRDIQLRTAYLMTAQQAIAEPKDSHVRCC